MYRGLGMEDYVCGTRRSVQALVGVVARVLQKPGYRGIEWQIDESGEV